MHHTSGTTAAERHGQALGDSVELLSTATHLAGSVADAVTDTHTIGAKSPTKAVREDGKVKRGVTKIRISIGGQSAIATLLDTASSNDFVSMLPLTLTLKDYSRTEKVSDLPRALSTSGSPAGYKPCAGDIAYYAPWANLAIFYRDFRHLDGLIKLGKIYAGMDVLNHPDPIAARIERAEP